jgi:MFS family permease
MADDEKSDGFNFAIIAVTTLLGFLSAIYIYFQKYPIEEKWYTYASLLIPVTIVSISFFIIYVIIYGISIKMQDDNKRQWDTLAAIVYHSAFLLFAIILIYLLSLIFSAINPENFVIVIIIYILMFFFIWIKCLEYFSFLFCWDKIPGRDKEKLIEFLSTINIAWAKTAIVEKIYNDTTIKVSTIDNWLYLRLNNEETKVNLNSNNGRTYEFAVKKTIDGLRNIKNFNIKGKSFLLRLGIILILFGFLVLYVFYLKSLLLANTFLLLMSILNGTFLYYFIIPKRYYKWVFSITSILFLIGLIIFALSITPFSYFINGDVIIDVGSIYHKNGDPIPVTIQVTGLNSNISIKLSKSDRENNLFLTDLIENIEPNHKPNILVSGNLSANSFENGKYGLFINTTNLSPGYYELNVTRPKNVKIAIKGFYLLNDSKSNYNPS